jgi:hypothetical protein
VKRDIEASTTIQIPIEQATEVLVDDLRRILADPANGDRPDAGHAGDRHADGERSDHLTSMLVVGLGASGSVSKEVEVDVGNASSGDGVTTVPLHWHTSGRDRLFPSFDGVLEASAEALGASLLTVRGTYTVPLGPVGRFGDGVIGRRLARQSLAAFVEGLARRLDGEAHRRAAAVSWHPAPYPVTVRESAASSSAG